LAFLDATFISITRVTRRELLNVRRVKPQWEEPVLYFWIDDLPDIMDIILAEEKARKEAEAAKKVKEEPPMEPPTSLCQSCFFVP
jgi:hypothetical protein